jgi:hypothetical protein
MENLNHSSHNKSYEKSLSFTFNKSGSSFILQ